MISGAGPTHAAKGGSLPGSHKVATNPRSLSRREDRASRKAYGKLSVVVPSVGDLLAPKLKRGEPRDKLHAQWATQLT
jgi:hypothetical protein